jgi:hypothetical protein
MDRPWPSILGTLGIAGTSFYHLCRIFLTVVISGYPGPGAMGHRTEFAPVGVIICVAVDILFWVPRWIRDRRVIVPFLFL